MGRANLVGRNKGIAAHKKETPQFNKLTEKSSVLTPKSIF